MSYDVLVKRCFNLEDHAEHTWELRDVELHCPGMPDPDAPNRNHPPSGERRNIWGLTNAEMQAAIALWRHYKAELERVCSEYVQEQAEVRLFSGSRQGHKSAQTTTIPLTVHQEAMAKLTAQIKDLRKQLNAEADSALAFLESECKAYEDSSHLPDRAIIARQLRSILNAAKDIARG